MNRSITDPQLAMLIERVEHIAKRMDDLMPLVTLITTLQRDQEYAADSIKQLHAVAEMRGAALHAMDKRLSTLEWWHKYRLAQPALILTVALAAWSYWQGFTGSMEDFKTDTRSRVSALEFIINAPHFERSMANDSRPVAEGGKD